MHDDMIEIYGSAIAIVTKLKVSDFEKEVILGNVHFQKPPILL